MPGAAKRGWKCGYDRGQARKSNDINWRRRTPPLADIGISPSFPALLAGAGPARGRDFLLSLPLPLLGMSGESIEHLMQNRSNPLTLLSGVS
jgi:hypothetical protein